jgi:hypothetical protein
MPIIGKSAAEVVSRQNREVLASLMLGLLLFRIGNLIKPESRPITT